MEDFNQNTPRPSTEGPRMSANHGELYAQITAEDEEVVTVAPKKQSHIISLMAILMKITFHIDAFRRSNERLFIFLHSIWAGAMSVLYLSGIITLCLCIFSFAQLPTYLKDYLDKNGIQYGSLEMPDYSLSQINITNLKDINNNYTIPSVTIHSTFADLLQNRIRMLEINGLRINLNNKSNNDLEGAKLLFGLLEKLSAPNSENQDLNINIVHVNNAALTVQGKEQNVSVAFSLSGTYMNENQVVIPFSINEDFLRIDAFLQITGPQQNRQIEIKTTNVGEITLPQRLPEKLEGNITLKMQQNNIQNILMDAKLSRSNSIKKIQVDLENNGQNKFDGNFMFAESATENAEPTTDLVLYIKELELNNDGQLISNAPLQLNLKHFENQFVVVNDLQSNLNGQLNCSLKNKKCDYTIQKESMLNVNAFSFDIKNQSLFFSNPSAFTLKSVNKKAITLQFKNPYMQLELPIKGPKLNGYIGTNQEKLSIEADDLNLIVHLGQDRSDNHLQLSVKKANYQTSGLTINEMDLFVEDYFNPTAKIQLNANKLQTSSPLMLKPVKLDILNIGEQTSVKGSVLDTPIAFEAYGILNPFKSYFSGKFSIPEFDLNQLPFELSELSQIFPSKLSNVGGQVMAYGQLNLSDAGITGPMNIALKDIEFDLDGTNVSGLNSVLKLKSLLPLITNNNQNLFVQNIQALVPISNLDMQFQINNQSLRLANLNAQIAGQDVMMSSTLIPMKNPSEILSLKTAGTFDSDDLNDYMQLSGISIEDGKASLNIPVFISNNGIDFGNLTLKLSNTTWQKQSDETLIPNLFSVASTGYTVRSGQLILNADNELDVTLDGWLLPDNIKKSYGPNLIQLDEPLFLKSQSLPVPSDIQNEQNQLFETENIK